MIVMHQPRIRIGAKMFKASSMFRQQEQARRQQQAGFNKRSHAATAKFQKNANAMAKSHPSAGKIATSSFNRNMALHKTNNAARINSSLQRKNKF
jgi:hypothetical protein